jgi:HlyD family secretion protein
VVEDGHAVARQVETGIQSDSHIEIASGLDEGQEVVVGNYRAISKDLTHGAAVTTGGEGGEGGGEGEQVARRDGPGA